ncbi:MAG: D-glycero-beta-D-manno-heptose-7-phosphate kinase [Acidobacteriota bacterium]
MRNRLLTLLSQLSHRRIAVLGDFLLDEFVFGEIARVSREAPVLILRYHETQCCPGGGANTVANVAALGAEVYPVGVIGGDEAAGRLLELWPDNVSRKFLVRDPGARTTRKSRVLAGLLHSFRQQVVRIDYEHPLAATLEQEERLLAALEGALAEAEALIISDYTLGTVTPALARKAVNAARSRKLPVVADSRDHPAGFAGATAVTPNISEVEAAMMRPAGGETSRLEELGREARQRFGVEALLVTRGKWGMSLFTDDSVLHIPPYGVEEAVDVTGAGDTVAAVFGTALAAGATPEDAARLANLAGGLVVAKKGTATVSVQELERAVQDA